MGTTRSLFVSMQGETTRSETNILSFLTKLTSQLSNGGKHEDWHFHFKIVCEIGRNIEIIKYINISKGPMCMLRELRWFCIKILTCVNSGLGTD